VRQLTSNGVAVVRITAAGHDAFRAAVQSVSVRWREAIGSDVVALAEQAIAASRPPVGK
jgi:Holliday junction resolvase